MAKNQDKIKEIRYNKVTGPNGMPLYRFKIYTDGIDEVLRISGHRFVNLVYNHDFINDADTLLQFLSAKPFIENEYTLVGKRLEQPLIDKVTKDQGLENVQTFGFEDLENGTDEFYFIRDLEYTKDGEEYIGEIKTFFNKKKVGLDSNPVNPRVDYTWWLQVRLELEILKPVGSKGKVFFYYVDKPTKQAVVKERPYTIKDKYLFTSEDIIKQPPGEYEQEIDIMSDGRAKTFQDLMNLALERKEELCTMYEDDEGTFFYAEAPIYYPWFNKFDHIKNFIEEMREFFTIREDDTI